MIIIAPDNEELFQKQPFGKIYIETIRVAYCKLILPSRHHLI